MKETYKDKFDNIKKREHWKAYGNKKKKDHNRYIKKNCISSKFEKHTIRVRKKKKKKKSYGDF